MSKKAMNDKPHISSGIKVSIAHKDWLFKNFLENKNDENRDLWKRYKNKVTETIRNAEKLHYKKIIGNHKNSTTQLWKTFGKILNKNRLIQ